MRIVIISGRSGSGKSICLHVLEDLGFYCIDNLPLSLLPVLAGQIGQYYGRLAVSIDARNLPEELHRFDAILGNLKSAERSVEVLYLDASDQVLLKRFSETRRRHPLTDEVTPLTDAITQEKQLLEPIAMDADLHIDTSQLSLYQLRDFLCKRVGAEPSQSLSVLIQSFGYKGGVPVDADFVFDVRCLPNPYWEPGLGAYTGKDLIVESFMENQTEVLQMLADITQFLETWIPNFEGSNRRYLTVAIGCTGGQHRSVYLVERLAKYFMVKRDKILIHHRDLT